MSIAYFPRYFACYFSLFHVYFFCYPFGFSYLALQCCALFVLHSMIHLWNSFEVPAYFRGGLSPVHPRQIGQPLYYTCISHLSLTLPSRFLCLQASRTVPAA
ncbi:hypothetical protein EON64_00975 [archaeon]|nr:MAG: hypothetical protein EON64_00975 [archaeon]